MKHKRNMPDVYKAVGDKIRIFRKINKYTQKKLANSLNIARTTLTNMELGNQAIQLDILVKIAQELKMDLKNFFPEIETSKKETKKAYKLEILVIDLNEVGSKEIVSMIENTNYRNYCISPEVMDIEERDIGEWSDEHPLNSFSLIKNEYNRLFKKE